MLVLLKRVLLKVWIIKTSFDECQLLSTTVTSPSSYCNNRNELLRFFRIFAREIYTKVDN